VRKDDSDASIEVHRGEAINSARHRVDEWLIRMAERI